MSIENKNKEIAPLTNILKVTSRQLEVIRSALEIYDRLLMGHFENPLWQLFMSRDMDSEAFDEACWQLKQIIFPELVRHQHYGVGWKEDDTRQNNSQMAYEIEAMIKHLEWKRKPDRTPYLTSSSPPLHYSTESLIELEKIEIVEKAEEVNK